MSSFRTTSFDNNRTGTAGNNQVAPLRPTGVILHLLQSLYRILENEELDSGVVRWSKRGDSFIVLDHARLERGVIAGWPEYNTWPMFVSLLETYGFHKVGHPQQSGLMAYRFAHQNFRRGYADILGPIELKGPNTVVPEGHRPSSPLLTSPRPSPQQILLNLPSGRMLDLNSLPDDTPAIEHHLEAISSKLSELKKSNEYLREEAMASRGGRKEHQDTTNLILKLLVGVLGNAVPSPVHESGDGGLQTDIHILRKRQRLVISDSRSGNTHDTFARQMPLTSELFAPINDHMEPTPSPPGLRASTSTVNQIVLPAQNASHPTNSAPVPQFNPAPPPGSGSVDAPGTMQSNMVQNTQDPTPNHPALLPVPSSSPGVTATAHPLPPTDPPPASNEPDTRLHEIWGSAAEDEDSVYLRDSEFWDQLSNF